MEDRSQRSLETLVKMGERLGVTPASPLKHSDSAKFASLQELESHVGHILPLDEAQAQMDDRAGAPRQNKDFAGFTNVFGFGADSRSRKNR